MIREEIMPHRIRELLAACNDQPSMVRRLIVEAEPAFEPERLRILLGSKRWGVAVNPNLIIDRNNSLDQFARAEAILGRFHPGSLAGKRFLDFGCGDGYLARLADRKGATAVGYDLVKPTVSDSECVLTDSWESVVGLGPYDVVMVYDVLDHSRDEHPIDCLKRVKKVLAPGGVVLVRFHPWCSRSGTHCYTAVNKAYLHLLFTPDQLEEMGAPGIWTRRVIHPNTVYSDWVLKAGFTKRSEEVMREAVEPFWSEDPYVRGVLQDHWKDSYDEKIATGVKFPTFQLEVSFVDLQLVVG